MTQLEAPTEYKNILPKRVSHDHNQKPGQKTSCKNACKIAKHNSDSEVNVITIFGNCNVVITEYCSDDYFTLTIVFHDIAYSVT